MIEEQTTRQKIRDFLERSLNGASPSRVEQYFDRVQDEEIAVGEVITHIEHLQKSQKHKSWQLFVRPPECLECYFNDFDDVVNIPSQCPKCRSERIQEPAFDIKED